MGDHVGKQRTSVKVILVDSRERVLLVRGRDPGRPELRPFWFPPGGGVEEDESLEAAAAREVREEVGIEIAPSDLGDAVSRREATFEFEGRPYQQEEHYFLLRLDHEVEVTTEGWTEVERRAVTSFHWWTLPELRMATDKIFPEALVTLLDEAEVGTPLVGGSVSEVVQVGDTVRRPTGPWTPAVHALLNHLEDVGFPAAPRVLGIDEKGREILTHVPGTTARRPWPAVMLQSTGLTEMARWLVAYHDAVRDFEPPRGSRWRSGAAPSGGEDEIISHGDLGPWNSVWQQDRLVGLIDWDFAEPRRTVEDLAEVAWYFVPLQGPRVWREAGFGSTPDFRGRLHLLCEAYGRFNPAETLDALHRRQHVERVRTLELGAAGIHPWALFLERGDVAQFDEEAGWLQEHREHLIR